MAACQSCKMIFIGKAWHRIIGLLLKPCRDQATLGGCTQHGQASTMEQIVDEGRDEYGLACAGQARHAETQGATADEISQTGRRNPRFIAKSHQAHESPRSDLM